MPPALKTDKERLADAMQYVSELQAQLTQTRRDLRAANKEELTRERIRTEIMGLMARDPEPPKWLETNRNVTGDRGIPCCLWTDWHIGEVVTRERTNGLNEYNLRVAKKRAAKLVDNTIEIAFEHMGRAKYTYPGAVIMLGGDMLTGSIHEDLTITNDLTNQEQINECTDLLATCIDQMATKFSRLFIPAVTGNHPRDQAYSRKMPSKLRVVTSHEWVVYCNLKRYFAKNKSIQFLIPENTDAIFSVAGHRYLLTHGDAMGVRGGSAIIGALGPIARGALKVHDTEAQVGNNIDSIILGHYHQRISMEGVIVGNSFIGFNEYGRSSLRAKFTRPSQPLWFTHKKYGVTAQWEIFLEEKAKSEQKEGWVSWKAN